MRVKFNGLLVFILCTFILTSEISGAKNDVGEIIRRVEKTLDNLITLNCSFERSYYNKASDRTTKISGVIHIKKPNRIRVEYSSQIIVVDGEKTWVYVPANNQVQISDFIEGDDTFPTPQSIFEKYSKERKIESEGTEEFEGKMCEALNFIPSKTDEDYIHVLINTDINFPIKTISESTNGDTTVYILRNIVLNGEIDDKLFIFEIPDGVETIDLRE